RAPLDLENLTCSFDAQPGICVSRSRIVREGWLLRRRIWTAAPSKIITGIDLVRVAGRVAICGVDRRDMDFEIAAEGVSRIGWIGRSWLSGIERLAHHQACARPNARRILVIHAYMLIEIA